MTKFFARLRDVLKGERGATAIEYGLIIGLIAVVIIIAVTALGTQINSFFCGIVTALGGTC